MKHWKPDDVIEECARRGYTLVNRSFAMVIANLLNNNPKDRPPKAQCVAVWNEPYRSMMRQQ